MIEHLKRHGVFKSQQCSLNSWFHKTHDEPELVSRMERRSFDFWRGPKLDPDTQAQDSTGILCFVIRYLLPSNK